MLCGLDGKLIILHEGETLILYGSNWSFMEGVYDGADSKCSWGGRKKKGVNVGGVAVPIAPPPEDSTALINGRWSMLLIHAPNWSGLVCPKKCFGGEPLEDKVHRHCTTQPQQNSCQSALSAILRTC